MKRIFLNSIGVVTFLAILLSCSTTNKAVKSASISLPVKSDFIVTPAPKNVCLAEFDGGKIYEHDVFGKYDILKIPKKMSIEKRHKKISNYIMDKLFGFEGENTDISKSLDYKIYKDKVTNRISAQYLYTKEIGSKFVSNKLAKDYYKKYPTIFTKSFNLEKNKIVKILLKSEKKEKEASKFAMSYMDSLKEKYAVYYNQELFKQIYSFNFIAHKVLEDSLIALKKRTGDAILVRYNGLSKRISNLIVICSDYPAHSLRTLKNISRLKGLVEGKFLNDILTLEAKNSKIAEQEDVQEAIRYELRFWFSAKYKEKIFGDSNFNPTKKEMLDYYYSHPNDNDLKNTKKMKVHEIFKTFNNNDDDPSNDKIKVAIELQQIREKIRSGEDFDKYARLYHRKMSRKGNLNYIFATDHGEVGLAADTMKVGAVSELIYNKRAISIIKVLEVVTSKIYKFEYVDQVIKEKLINQGKIKKRKELLKALFKKYNVKFL